MKTQREKAAFHRVSKTGNSFCVVIPKRLLAELGWERGDTVIQLAENNKLMMAKVDLGEMMRAKEIAAGIWPPIRWHDREKAKVRLRKWPKSSSSI